jgi:hypothetical protein
MSRTDRPSPRPLSWLAAALPLLAGSPLLAAEVVATVPATPVEPLAGFSDGQAFLRSADGAFQLFPSGAVQIDGYFYKSKNKTPFPSFLDRRARLDMSGWIGERIFFAIGGDFAASPNAAASNLNATDDYVGIAPWGQVAMLQVGQFDAPFTLENRTSNKTFDFIERAATVRAFGAPSNKEQGAMVHGLLPGKVAYYSLGLFDGDGTNFKNQDDAFDVIGRAWVAPFAIARLDLLSAVTVGGSHWSGDRKSPLTQTLANQTTQGGFSFFSPKWNGAPAVMGGTGPAFELRPSGNLRAWGLEVNAPIGHRLGARLEWVKKQQRIATITTSGTPALVPMSGGNHKGWGLYGELWGWVLGDDTLIGTPGLQLPPARLGKVGTKPLVHGLMLAARLDMICQGVEEDGALNTQNPLLGNTRLTALTLGANYWRSKRFRATFNWVLNRFSGDTAAIAKLPSRTEQEFLFRLGAGF